MAATYRLMTHADLMSIQVFEEPTATQPSRAMYLKYITEYQMSLVAVHPNGRIVGHLLAKLDGILEQRHGHIRYLHVDPAYRRSGIGCKLLEQFTGMANHNGAFWCYALLRGDTYDGIGPVFLKAGFKRCRTILNAFEMSDGTEEDGIEMRQAMSLLDPQKLTEQFTKEVVRFEEAFGNQSRIKAKRV